MKAPNLPAGSRGLIIRWLPDLQLLHVSTGFGPWTHVRSGDELLSLAQAYLKDPNKVLREVFRWDEFYANAELKSANRQRDLQAISGHQAKTSAELAALLLDLEKDL